MGDLNQNRNWEGLWGQPYVNLEAPQEEPRGYKSSSKLARPFCKRADSFLSWWTCT